MKINYKVLDANQVDSLPEQVDINYGTKQKEVDVAQNTEREGILNLEGLPITTDIVNIGALPNEAYAMLRRNGFGASDSSSLLNVNPYKTLADLIKEKASDTMSEEEREIGYKVSVRKGNDLEPLIMKKYEYYFGTPTIKPVDMYKFIDYPQMKINFDGVTQTSNGTYFPVEIKVATQWGQKHYNPVKTIFTEQVGIGLTPGFAPLPEDVSDRNWSIETKAAHYGIPPYYYTQVQVEMLALNANYGHLAVLFDKDWTLNVFHVWRDITVQNDIIIQSFKMWDKVLALRVANGWADPSGESLRIQYEGTTDINRSFAEGNKEINNIDEY